MRSPPQVEAVRQDAADAGSAAHQSRFITYEGRRIHYLDWGTPGRQPFVMLHGFGRSAHRFDHIAPHFLRDYHVIAMDLRGHGDSDWHPNAAYLVEDFVKDLEALVDQLGLRDVALTGNSMGGRVVQVYAGLHPDRVAKVIVEDVGPERPETVSSALGRRVEQEREGWASMDELLSSVRRPSTVSDEMHRHWIREESRQRANGRVGWKFDPDVVKGLVPTELWEHVRRIKAPTLYVLGANSNIVPPETQQELEALPTAEVVVIPDAGHYPHEQTPLVFVAVVKAFLAGGGR